MPGFDRTGPRGMGPMTGGGRGLCNPSYTGASTPYGGFSTYGRPYGWGYVSPAGGYYSPYPNQPYGYSNFSRGFGRGRGMGRGRW